MDSVIILCAGSGSRARLDYNKIFYPLGSSTVLDTVISRFSDFGFGRIILAVSAADLETVRSLYPHHVVVEGGVTRSDSVRNALQAAEGSEVVAIHDAARPFVSLEVIARAMDSARKTGSGVPAVKSIDHVCMGSLEVSGYNTSSFSLSGISSNNSCPGCLNNDNNNNNKEIRDFSRAHFDNDGLNGGESRTAISEYLPKERLFNIQTPQCFRFDEILEAYKKIRGSFADDSEVYMRAGFSPTLTDGDYKNKKLTTPADFVGLGHYQAVGSGFDVHRLVEGRRLILGGVDIPHDKGLLGHSDADVLAHALSDAILSAAGVPDIGVLFPDTDPAFLGADSMVLLEKAHGHLLKAGKKLASVSCVIIAQKPKLAGFIPSIRESIAGRLGLSIDQVNISATTTEFLGLVGEGQAIAASAAVLCG